MLQIPFEDTLLGRENTMKTQKCLVRRWIRPYFSELICPTITQYDCMIVMQQVWLKAHHLRGRTLVALLGLLERYITYYGGNITLKSVKKLARENIHDTGVKALHDFEYEKLVFSCTDPTLKSILLCGLHAGLRKGEVFGLMVEDVSGKCLLVKRSYDGPTKNGKSRVIPMTKALKDSLNNQIKGREPQEKVFKVFDPNRALKLLCYKARIRQITFHQLRHSCATNLLNKGCSIKQVQEILGHAKPSTTMDVYWSSIIPNLNINSYF